MCKLNYFDIFLGFLKLYLLPMRSQRFLGNSATDVAKWFRENFLNHHCGK